MARSTRDSKLENRTSRAHLKAGKRHWRTIGKGLALGYRRGVHGGTWYCRRLLPGDKYQVTSIGIADDHRDADGATVLDFFQAQDKARGLSKLQGATRARLTVGDVLDEYLTWAEANSKGYQATRRAAEAHIRPALGAVRVENLTATVLRDWHQGLANAPARTRGKPRKLDRKDGEALRRRRATANRILTVLKAALNRAFENERIGSDSAWRRVKPFPKADAPRIRYLTADEARRLINAAAPDFRALVRAALLTGARYGELVALRCGDFHPDSRTVLIRESKAGRPRHIPLTDEGTSFFETATAGRASDALMFTRADGHAWGKSHQFRPMRDACAAAKVSPPCSFHDLRNTYGALLAMAGTPIKVIAELLGHADSRVTEKHYAHLSASHVADTLRQNLPRFEPKTPAKVRRLTTSRRKRT